MLGLNTNLDWIPLRATRDSKIWSDAWGCHTPTPDCRGGVVEHVKEIGVKLDIRAFANRETLYNGEVPVALPRSTQRVPAYISDIGAEISGERSRIMCAGDRLARHH